MYKTQINMNIKNNKIKKIGITGALGHIGMILVDAFEKKYDITKIDKNYVASENITKDKSICAKIENADEISGLFNGLDAVIHLAGDKRTEANWESIHASNIIGTYNVLEECRKADVKRFIFASSNHVQNGYAIETTPETLNTSFYKNNNLINLLDQPFPDSIYGVSKIFGEELCKFYSKKYHMQIISLRIGWTVPEDNPLVMKNTPAENYMRAMFLSKRDCVQVFSKTLNIPMNSGQYIVAYAISNNDKRIFDLTETKKILGYNPKDNAEKFFKNL